MRLNEIKFSLKKLLPKRLFSLTYTIWTKIIKPLLDHYHSVQLQRFKTEQLRSTAHEKIDYKILINPKNGTVDNEIFLHGVYEPFFLSLIKKDLKAGDTFVDIGANIGQHSIFASKCVGNGGKVISFEPIKRLFNQFSESKLANNAHNINIYNLACGKEKATMNISIAPDNAGASSLVSIYESGSKEEISIIAADEILLKEKNINFIKIDVEGFEYNALLGLQKTLKEFHPKILIEYSPYYYISSGNSSHCKDIYNLLKSFKYEIIDIENNNKVVDEKYIEKLLKEKKPQTNFLCV